MWIKFKYILVTLALLLPTTSNLYAQQRPQQPPQEASGCPGPVLDYGSLPVDAKVQYLMSDTDGDWWIIITVTNNGKQFIGFLNHKNNKLCIVGEGKINPKT